MVMEFGVSVYSTRTRNDFGSTAFLTDFYDPLPSQFSWLAVINERTFRTGGETAFIG